MRDFFTGLHDKHDYSADHRDFLVAVAGVILSTSRIDGALFELSRCVLTGFDDRRISHLFHRSPSIADHLRFVDMLMSEFLDSEIAEQFKTEWVGIRKEAEAVIEFRNHIAHNPASFRSRMTKMQPTEEGMQWTPGEEPGYFFIATSWDRVVRKDSPATKDVMQFRVADLNASTERAIAVKDRVLALVHALVGRA